MAKAIHEEWSVQRRRVHTVVDGKLNHWEAIAPMDERMRIASEYFNQNAIDAFCLAVGLRVIGRRHRQPSADEIEDSRPKRGRELGITVRNQVFWHPVMTEDEVDKDTSRLFCRDGIFDSSKMYHLAVAVTKDQYASVAGLVGRKPEDKVQGHGLPTLCRDRQRL